jgi:hypothetical protein
MALAQTAGTISAFALTCLWSTLARILLGVFILSGNHKGQRMDSKQELLSIKQQHANRIGKWHPQAKRNLASCREMGIAFAKQIAKL